MPPSSFIPWNRIPPDNLSAAHRRMTEEEYQQTSTKASTSFEQLFGVEEGGGWDGLAANNSLFAEINLSAVLIVAGLFHSI